MNDFESTFDPKERSLVALFSLFTRVVDLKILWYMGIPEFVCHDDTSHHWAIPELVGLTQEYWNALAQKASLAGLLSPTNLGYWNIDERVQHGLRPYLSRKRAASRLRLRAFVESTTFVANQCHDEQKAPNPSALKNLILNEPNFLAAFDLAKNNGWPRCALTCLLALQHTHQEPAQFPRWRALVSSVVPLFIDLKTDDPKAGRESDWPVITSFRIGNLIREHRLAEARALQLKVLESLRSESDPWLTGNRPINIEGIHTIGRLAGEYCRAAAIEDKDDQHVRAYGYLQQALALSPYIPRQFTGFIMQQLAALCQGMGNREEAERWVSSLQSAGYVDAYQLLTQAEIPLSKAEALTGHECEAPRRAEYLDDAQRSGDAALALVNRDDRALMARTYSVLARVQTACDRLVDAQDSYQQALFFYQAMGNKVGAARAEANIASLLESRGFRRQALFALQRAQALLEGQVGAGAQIFVQIRVRVQELQAAMREVAGNEAPVTDKVIERDEVIRGMIANIRRGDERHYSITLAGYFIDDYPYPASAFGIDSHSNPELHATEDGFACFAYFPVRNLQPKTVEKHGIVRMQFGEEIYETVRVPVRIRAADIIAIGLSASGKQYDLYSDRETSATRHSAFMRETGLWFEQRNADKAK